MRNFGEWWRAMRTSFGFGCVGWIGLVGWLVGCVYSLTQSLLGRCIYDFVGLQFSRFSEVELTKRCRTL